MLFLVRSWLKIGRTSRRTQRYRVGGLWVFSDKLLRAGHAKNIVRGLIAPQFPTVKNAAVMRVANAANLARDLEADHVFAFWQFHNKMESKWNTATDYRACSLAFVLNSAQWWRSSGLMVSVATTSTRPSKWTH